MRTPSLSLLFSDCAIPALEFMAYFTMRDKPVRFTNGNVDLDLLINQHLMPCPTENKGLHNDMGRWH